VRKKSLGGLGLLSICLTAFVPTYASAQYANNSITDLTPPEVPVVDDYNVNIRSGELDITVPVLTIGQGNTALSYNVQTEGSYFRGGHHNDYQGHIQLCDVADQLNYGRGCRYYGGGNALQVRFGRIREIFFQQGSVWKPANERGAKFEDLGSTCLYTTRDGVKVRYASMREAGRPHCLSNTILDVTYPDGRKHTYSSAGTTELSALNIRTNYGVMLKMRSRADSNPYNRGIDEIDAINLAVDYCSPTLVYCDFSRAWPSARIEKRSFAISPAENFRPNYQYNGSRNYETDVIDHLGNRTRFTMDSLGRVKRYHPAGSPQGQYVYVYCSELNISDSSRNMVNCFHPPAYYQFSNSDWTGAGSGDSKIDERNFHRNKITESFRYNDSVTYMNRVQRDGPSYLPFTRWTAGGSGGTGRRVSGTGNSTPGLPHYGGANISIRDNRGNSATYEATNRNWVKSVATAGQTPVTYTYDSRGNVIKTTQPLSSQPGAPVVETTASYSATCSNLVICNKPNSVTDARGKTTNYTYNSTHGSITKITGPADANGIRPQTRFFYVS